MKKKKKHKEFLKMNFGLFWGDYRYSPLRLLFLLNAAHYHDRTLKPFSYVLFA